MKIFANQLRLTGACFLALPLFAYGQRSVQVHLKTDTVITSEYGYVKNVRNGKGFVRIDNWNGRKINIEEVDLVERINRRGTRRYFKPILFHNDTIWAERIFASNRIVVYYTEVIRGGKGDTFKRRYFRYTKDDGPLRKLKGSNLKRDLGDNKESLHQVEIGQSFSIIQGVLTSCGAILIGGSIIWFAKPDPGDDVAGDEFGVPLVATGLLLLSWSLSNTKEGHFLSALALYK